MVTSLHSCIIIGTGFSGLAMAIKLKKNGIHDFIILEKAKDVGGTWRENTYPGAECDIPSVLYSYSFEPYPKWKYKWSMQPQILEYVHHVVNKYELRPHMHFNQEMTGAEWDESKSTWTVTTKTAAYEGKTLVSAIGQLHHPSIPNFKGKDLFAGPKWHSAQWNHDVILKGKTVGVIGNAASAVQFIPEIAKTADKVVVFQRSANWMLPKLDRPYFEWEKNLANRFPFLLKMYRLSIWLKGGTLFPLMNKGNKLLRNVMESKTKSFIKEQIENPELAEKLVPDYPLGAKRVLFSDTYYPALAQPHVYVVHGGVKEITTSGVINADNTQHDIDILIYSTGFKTNPFLMGLDIKGKQGVALKEHWKEEPKTYMGMTVDNFPNLFIMYGPNTNLGHNSIIIMSEAQSSYIAQCIKAMKDNNWKTLEVKKDVVDKEHEVTQNRLKDMIWAQVEDSWYKSANGNLPNNYPGRTMEYIRKTKKVDFGVYEVG